MANLAKRVGPTAGAAAAATLFTNTADNGFLWRSLNVANTTTGDLSFRMSIGADAPGTRLYSDFVVPANFTFEWTGLIFLADNETIQWNAPTGLTATIGGIEQT